MSAGVWMLVTPSPTAAGAGLTDASLELNEGASEVIVLQLGKRMLHCVRRPKCAPLVCFSALRIRLFELFKFLKSRHEKTHITSEFETLREPQHLTFQLGRPMLELE
jgi:hypothetical protein